MLGGFVAYNSSPGHQFTALQYRSGPSVLYYPGSYRKTTHFSVFSNLPLRSRCVDLILKLTMQGSAVGCHVVTHHNKPHLSCALTTMRTHEEIAFHRKIAKHSFPREVHNYHNRAHDLLLVGLRGSPEAPCKYWIM